MRPGFEIRFIGYVFNFLKSHFRPEISAKIKFAKLLKGREAAAFDIPSEFV